MNRVRFVAGWCCWVAFGALDAGDSEDFVAGFKAAEAANNAGGARPTRDDAEEAAREAAKESA